MIQFFRFYKKELLVLDKKESVRSVSIDSVLFTPDREELDVEELDEVVTLTHDLPNSGIVHNKLLNFQDKYVLLCDKYVATLSEYPINISYDVRQKLIYYRDMFKKQTIDLDLTDNQKITIFNEVLHELNDNLYKHFHLFLRCCLVKFKKTL